MGMAGMQMGMTGTQQAWGPMMAGHVQQAAAVMGSRGMLAGNAPYGVYGVLPVAGMADMPIVGVPGVGNGQRRPSWPGPTRY